MPSRTMHDAATEAHLKEPNIELSCAAASPARSEPQQRHSGEPEDHLRRQLQRFVMRASIHLDLQIYATYARVLGGQSFGFRFEHAAVICLRVHRCQCYEVNVRNPDCGLSPGHRAIRRTDSNNL